MSKVLCFSPYSAITKHSYPETFFVSQLKKHGHYIVHMGCQGLLMPFCIAHSGCGLTEASTNTEKEQVCQFCWKIRGDITSAFDESILINQFVLDEDSRNIADFVNHFIENYQEPYNLIYNNYPVGRIASYEFILNHKIMDMKSISTEMQSIFAVYLCNVLKIIITAERFLAYLKPDKIILYNSDYGTNHAVRLVGERMQIPTAAIHGGPHRALMYDSLSLSWLNILTYSTKAREFFASNFEKIRMDYSQYRYPLSHIQELHFGKSLWTYSAPKSNRLNEKYNRLPLLNKKIVLASMSSPDETYAASYSYFDYYFNNENRVFDNQYVWLQVLIDYFTQHPEYILIIRPHPREYPNKREQIKSASATRIEEIVSRLPENIVTNFPDENVSITDLLSIVDLHLVATSTVCLESGCIGIPTMSHVPRMKAWLTYPIVSDMNEYFNMIESVLNKEYAPDIAHMERVFRWYIFSQTVETINFSKGNVWDESERERLKKKHIEKFGNLKSQYDLYEKSMMIPIKEIKRFVNFIEEKKEVFELTTVDTSEESCNPEDAKKNYLEYVKGLFRLYTGIDVSRFNSFFIFNEKSKIVEKNAVYFIIESIIDVEIIDDCSRMLITLPEMNRTFYSLALALIATSKAVTKANNNMIPITNTIRNSGARKCSSWKYKDPSAAVMAARNYFSTQDYSAAFDIYEQLYLRAPQHMVPILAEAYQLYKHLPSQDRYTLYQSRFFEFGILSSDKVLDIGSGHLPFPLATHLGEFAIDDASYGRAGQPFKYVEGKPVIQCNVEEMPFADKEFDFIYCSHVLEHVASPEKACRELMRVGKRGYIEVPKRYVDLWFNTAKLSNHRWTVDLINGILVFREYTPEEIEGLQCNLLLDMNCNPQTDRERAFSALVNLKADKLNTMLLWEDSFRFEVRRGSY